MPKTCTFLPRGVTFEPFRIEHMVDYGGHYHLDLDPSFPIMIKAFEFDPSEKTYPLNWHERLEIFAAVSGSGEFLMGERLLDYSLGDVLVVDNNRMHGLKRVSGRKPAAVSVCFAPELVWGGGSPADDLEYLAVFYGRGHGKWPVVRDPAVDAALRRLLTVYFQQRGRPWFRTGCKAYLLELLHHLSRCFQESGALPPPGTPPRREAARLADLFGYLQSNYSGTVRVADAARRIGMSESRFMRFFKRTTGMTFVEYLMDLRLRIASRMLVEGEESVGQIALAAGFADQSYFDRRFKMKFGMAPRTYRACPESAPQQRRG